MSNPHARRLAAVLLSVLFVAPLRAQDAPTSVSLNVGIVSITGDVPSRRIMLAYPEVQLSRRLISFPKRGLALEGSLFWGFWTEGRKPAERSPHCCTTTQRAHLLGARVFAAPTGTPFSISPFAGVAVQFRRFTPIERIDDFGHPTRAYGRQYATVEGGLRVRLLLSERLGVELMGRGLVPLADEAERITGQFAVGAGLTCAL